MSERPTSEDLEDAAETGRRGCLVPQIDDASETSEDCDDE